MSFRILDKRNMAPDEIATIITAIGNHDEGTAQAVNPIAAALILGDKSDVRRSRVRSHADIAQDIHDRVNYSVTGREVVVEDGKSLELRLTVDTLCSSVMEFFEIFMTRMHLCRKAAATLGLDFRLVINGQQLG